MGQKAKIQRFGRQGAQDRPPTFAETLLSGKAIPRHVETYTPRLKPRPKAVFGTKDLCPMPQSYELQQDTAPKSWKFWR